LADFSFVYIRIACALLLDLPHLLVYYDAMLAKKIAQNGRHITVFYPETSSGMPSTKNETSTRDRSREATARSKNLLKKKLYLSPQLNTFLTLTYAKQNADVKMIQNDLKNVFSRNGREYVAVIERHKSGALHIHAVVNWEQCNFTLNKYKHYTFADWTKGFSNVQKIKYKDYDEVMSQQNLATLEQKDPVFLRTVLLVPDEYERRKLTYKKLKSFKDETPSVKDKVKENQKNPYYIPTGAAPTSNAIGFDLNTKEARDAAYQMLKDAQRKPLSSRPK